MKLTRGISDFVGGTVALAVIALFMLWVVPAYAADKGGPNVLDDLTQPSAKNPRWTGPWIGAHLGYSRLNVDENIAGIFGTSFSEKEVTYGVGAGIDARIPKSNLVVGVMMDVDFANTEAMDWAAFLGVRGGILVSPSALVYALGGYTWSEGDASDAGMLDRGLTVGAGVEAFVFKNTSLKLEYRYIDLGDEQYEIGGFIPASAQGDVQSIRLGLQYRF